MKKILSLILACLMLTGCLVACNKKEPDQGTNVTVDSDAKDSVLPDKDWEGQELKVMACVNDLVGNILENSDLTDPVGYEVYRRNAYLEEKYDFYITCRAADFGEYPSDLVRQEAYLGESSYDLILDAVRNMKAALAQFLYADLAELDYIDWDANGWETEANDSLDILGYRFLCTGDANLYEKSGAILMYYNRQIMSSITQEDIRQVALDGNWTMEKMYELMKLATIEDPTTGEISVYGLTHTDNEAFYNYLTTGFGMQIIKKDQDGNLSYSFDDAGTMEQTITAIDKVLEFYCDEKTTYNQRSYYSTPKAETIFLQNRSLFQPHLLCTMQTWRDSGVDYGVLPLPKANESIQKYGSAYYTGDTQFFVIPHFAKDADFSAFVLQALMENSGNLTRIYVEEQCKVRGSADSKDYDLITLALSNFVYDLGGIFDWGAIKTWIFIDRYDDNQAIQSLPVGGVNNFATSWAEKKDLAYYELNEFLMHFA